MGTHVQIPGVLTQDIDLNNPPSVEDILKKLQFKNNRVAVPTSSNPQTKVDPPANVKYDYARQHDVRGLQPKYREVEVNSLDGQIQIPNSDKFSLNFARLTI